MSSHSAFYSLSSHVHHSQKDSQIEERLRNFTVNANMNLT